jgi:drug/metabolite transporter (DMT)-like permease
MPRSTPTFRASPYLLLTLTVLFWSINWVIGRAIAGHVSPFAFTFLRWAGAVVVMLPFAWPQLREQWPAIRRNWKLIVWLGFWGTGLHNVFAYLGLQHTTATNGVILNSSVPIMIIVVGWLVYRDTLTRLQSLGVAISMAGVLAVLTRGDPSVLASLSLNKGDLIVLVGMVFWAAYTVFLRMKPKELGGLAMLASCCIVGVLILLPMFIAEMLFFGGHVEIRPATIAAVAYVAIFPSFVGYVFWNRAVAEVGSNVAGIFMHLMPVFGSLLAWMFLGERIELFHVAGIALILGGITLTSRAAPAPT